MRQSLHELATIVRSKNAGPFVLSLDVFFRDDDGYALAKTSAELTREGIAKAYQLHPEEVLSVVFFDAARAFKATLARRVSSGTVGDSDVFGAQQHAPLLDIKL